MTLLLLVIISIISSSTPVSSIQIISSSPHSSTVVPEGKWCWWWHCLGWHKPSQKVDINESVLSPRHPLLHPLSQYLNSFSAGRSQIEILVIQHDYDAIQSFDCCISPPELTNLVIVQRRRNLFICLSVWLCLVGLECQEFRKLRSALSCHSLYKCKIMSRSEKLLRQ